jgi:predicted nucleic acid-binding Zn ribbon protein
MAKTGEKNLSEKIFSIKCQDVDRQRKKKVFFEFLGAFAIFILMILISNKTIFRYFLKSLSDPLIRTYGYNLSG